MMRYDKELLQNPTIQVKIIINELRMLKSKAGQVRDLMNINKNEVPKIYSYL
jgi:hypothetical protein